MRINNMETKIVVTFEWRERGWNWDGTHAEASGSGWQILFILNWVVITRVFALKELINYTLILWCFLYLYLV